MGDTREEREEKFGCPFCSGWMEEWVVKRFGDEWGEEEEEEREKKERSSLLPSFLLVCKWN